MKFAAFTVSTPDYTPEEIVLKLKEFGYDGVEWRVLDQEPNPKATRTNGFWTNNKATLPLTGFAEHAAAYRKLADDAGLAIPSLGTYVSASEPEAVGEIMQAAASIGVTQLRVRVPEYDVRTPYQPLFDETRKHYWEIAQLAEKHGVKALLELHHKTIVTSASAARLFFDGFDPKHVGVIHDAGNLVFEGFEPYRMAFEILGPYLAYVHLKDAKWTPLKYTPDGGVDWLAIWAPVAKGSANIRALITALHDIGYDGWVTFEDFSLDFPIDERLQRNLSYVKNVLAELTASDATADDATPETPETPAASS